MFNPDTGQQFLSDLRLACGRLNPLTQLNSSHKLDNSLVTNIDKALSDFCKEHVSSKSFSFYSEEDFNSLNLFAIEPASSFG